MSIAVDFYANFAKRENSTLRPTASPYTLNCVLKDNCGIINPVLEIRGSGASFNPSQYNYCHISTFGRYYFVEEWEYNNATWLCRLKVDVLATYKTQIGNQSFYVLRSSYASNRNIVDTLYPVLSWQPNYYYDTVNFGFSRSMLNGTFIIGIANYQGTGHGAVSYYKISSTNLDSLMEYMLVPKTGWDNTFSGMSDVLYRSIYGPFDYIKTCKWFPVTTVDTTALEYIKFGNYQSDIQGRKLLSDVSYWDEYSETLYLPPSWLSLEAKYRTPPYARIYIDFNPWGVIELNPLDFTDSRTIKLYILPDFINGKAELRINKVVGSTEYFITKRIADFCVNIELTSSYIDAAGAIGGVFGAISGAASIASGAITGNGGQIAGGILGAGASIADIATALVPSIGGSAGATFGGAKALTGKATLIYQSTYFADENNSEFGKPLCDTRQISTIPGFVMCQNGDSYLQGAYKSEIDEVNEYLTGGFFYE